jgi:hypothetical protein
MINFFARCHVQRAHQHLRLQPAISIRKKDPFSLSQIRSQMAGMTLAKPALWQRLNAISSHPLVLSRESFQDLTGAIGGTVVYDNNFDLHPFLREKEANRSLDACFLILGRHNN